jgi:integrase
VSEIASLTWRDVQPRPDDGQVTVFGKGSKTRVVLLSNAIWRELPRLRQHAAQDAPVFPSRSGGGHLDPIMIERIVAKAALRAGAPIHLLQATLGHASVATTGRYLHARPTDSSSKCLAV